MNGGSFIMKKIKYIKQIDFAKKIGVSRQRITCLIKNGTISKNENGLIDYEKAKKIIESNREIHPSKAKTKTKPKTIKKSSPKKKEKTYAEARTEHELFKAKIAKLDYQKKKGELIDKKTRINVCQNIITVSKTKLLSISVKLAPQLVNIKSIKKIKNMIDVEVYQALNELSRLERLEK